MFDFNIITFHSAINFGAALQAYALQEFIKKQNYNVGIYDYIMPRAIGLKATFRAKVKKILTKFARDDKAKSREIQKYLEFREKHFNLNLETDSRVFVTGSDQVWNLNNSMDSMFFLQFLNNSVYKISYAASMAKTDIPNDRKDLLKKYLKTFDAISVREEGIKESLTPLCDKEISVNVDPTLLHDKAFYRNIASPVEGIPEKYILAYILHIPKNGNRLIKWLRKETGLPVVLLDSSGAVGMVIKNNMVVRDAGPREFIYLFDNAECVVTTSFHGTCFSLIFEKEFYSVVNPDSPSRISNLLKKVGIQPINESDTQFTRRDNIDWEHVRDVLAHERECSRRYIRDAFEKAKTKQTHKPSGTVALMNETCTGCAACEDVCPTNAIIMVLNSKGFYEPSIDETKCVNCSKCIQSCPLNTKLVVWPKKAYYGWNSSPDVLFKSSSGGAFYSIAQTVLQKGGVVFGAAYSEEWRDIVFECTDDVALEKLQKSKYTVSAASGVYKKIRKYLNDGRTVLFTGTPCQCAGIKSVFGDKYENLIVCDFVCGGMPSLSFYQEHIEALQKKYGSTIESLDFRPKDWGWGRYRFFVRLKNGEKYIKRDFADSYFRCFNSKVSERRVCEGCPYYHFHRSDFTIGDYWGYRAAGIKKNKGGMSLVVCNNEKAEKMFGEIKDFEKFEIPIEYTHYTVRDRIPRPNIIKEQDRFFKLAEEKGFEAAALEMYDINELHYYIKKLRKMLHL